MTVAAGEAETQDVPLVAGGDARGPRGERGGRADRGRASCGLARGENVFASFMRRIEGEAQARARGRTAGSGRRGSRPATNQRLDVRHDEYEERAIGGISLAAGRRARGVTVVMRRGLSVRGVVKDEDGRPLAGVEVTLSAHADAPGRSRRHADVAHRTGQPGAARDRGRRALRVPRPEGRRVHARRAAARASSRASVDPVKVAEAGDGAGRARPAAGRDDHRRPARHAGIGASGWYVSARPAGQGSGPALGPGSIRSEEPTGPDGVLRARGAHRRRELRPAGDGPRASAPARPGVTAPAEGVELTVSGTGQIRGRVVDAESGTPVPDFEVRYQPDAQGGMRFVMRMGPGRRARAVRAPAVPRGGRGLRARRRAGGPVDGRGVRPGLPERAARPR